MTEALSGDTDGTISISPSASNIEAYLGRVVRASGVWAVWLGTDAQTGHAVLIGASLGIGENVHLEGTPYLHPYDVAQIRRYFTTRPDYRLDLTVIAALLRSFDEAQDARRAWQTAETRIAITQGRIDRIVERAHEEAESRGWCSEFDDVMEDLGLPRRRREYRVRTFVTFEVEVDIDGIEAASEDDAINDVDQNEQVDMGWLREQLRDRLMHGDGDISLDAREATA